jgi:sialic acid synthase SpsE
MISIIAEIGINHDGNLPKALKLIEAAKACGADIVKFQMHLPKEQMLPDTSTADYVEGSIYDLLRKVSLSKTDFIEIKRCCSDNDIEFMCTPFSIKAIDWLEEIGVSRYKIGSGELTKLDFVEYIAKKGKPVIFSTGMATFSQVKETLDLLMEFLEEIVIMQCTSLYPPTHNQIDLNVLDSYKGLIETYPGKRIALGFSDHSLDNYACIGSVAKGVKFIEKHFTLDKRDQGPDHAISADINDFKALVRDIRIMEKCCGRSEKHLFEEEWPIVRMARHSLVLLKEVTPGKKLTKDNLGTKRPGDGIPANEYYSFLGKTVKKALKKDTLLRRDDLF